MHALLTSSLNSIGISGSSHSCPFAHCVYTNQDSIFTHHISALAKPPVTLRIASEI